MAPEMIKRKKYTTKVDIWSLGICLMELANGHLPFTKNSIRAMYAAGTVGYKEPLEKSKLWSDKFRNFLNSCLEIDPSVRPSSSQLLQVFPIFFFSSFLTFSKHQHEFLQDCDSAKSMKKVISGIFVLNTVLPF